MKALSVSITRRVAGFAWIGAALLGLAATLSGVSTAEAASSPLAGRQVSGFAELLLPSGPTTATDDADLTAALDAYARQAQPENLSDLEGYLATHPTSPWRVALLTNLGLAYYHYGYFSSAIDAWEQAWAQSRSFTDPAPAAGRSGGGRVHPHARPPGPCRPSGSPVRGSRRARRDRSGHRSPGRRQGRPLADAQQPRRRLPMRPDGTQEPDAGAGHQ